MGIILHIDSDDIKSLSGALVNAMVKQGVYIDNPIKDYDYYEDENDIPDIDPYLGVLPHDTNYGSCGGGCGVSMRRRKSYGGCFISGC